jgi:hypothetical protein
LFYAGYPGTHRVEKDTTIDMSLETLFGPVSDVSGSSVLFVLDFEALHWPLHDHQEINRRLGGMSGGPVFRLIEQGLTQLQFAGIVCAHADKELQLVFARSATVVSPDGRIG